MKRGRQNAAHVIKMLLSNQNTVFTQKSITSAVSGPIEITISVPGDRRVLAVIFLGVYSIKLEVPQTWGTQRLRQREALNHSQTEDTDFCLS